MTSPQGREIHPRWIYLTGALLLTALPFAAVDFAPGTDLPQHAAQARLLRELWGLAPATVDLSALVARPLGANTLCYWPLLGLSLIAPPELAVRVTVFAWLAAALAGWHVLAWRRERPASHALAAGMLLFGLPLYWGLLNFLSGLGLFFVFTERALRARPRTRADLAIDAALVALLYLAHVLWVAVAALLAAAVALRAVLDRRDLRGALGWLAVFAPAGLLIAPWFADLVERRAATGVALEAQYLTPFAERLSPSWLTGSVFGGIRGPFEPVVVACLAGYAALAILRARRSRLQGVDPPLLALGAVGLGWAVLAPDQYLNTLLFNDRYFGCSVMFLLLGLPSPRGRALPVLAGLLSIAFALVTTAAWVTFDAAELSGLGPSLAKLDRPRRVLGLDYRKHSEVLRDRPFMQLFAYTQAAHGGELSFSFAEHQSSIVSYRQPPRRPWSPGLEWSPERATARDLAAFDCVLVNADAARHAAFAARYGLRPLADEGFLRLYCQGAK